MCAAFARPVCANSFLIARLELSTFPKKVQVAPGLMIESLLCCQHVDLLAVPYLQNGMLDNAGKRTGNTKVVAT
jgi:hypothetical protein